ncbi:hypothetical protein [Moraxella nonliquefaciens]|uniref:hypothetical protein n=1 Tax=Moraxella nonliquefaciens TaxID=478 RepID=UPI0012E93AA0|nr:hypothetical protein [Moraxella nonliquefaciens]
MTKRANIKNTHTKRHHHLKKVMLVVLAVFVLIFVASWGMGFYQNSQDINPIPVAIHE